MNYFTPKDTNELLERKKLKAKDIDNFFLRLHRFIKKNYNINKGKYEFNIRDIKGSTNIKTDKVEKYYESIKNIYTINESLIATNNWRLAIGIGSGSVYETSISLHHIYGIPYIPAQSIKGTLRSFIIEKYFDSKEEKAFEDSAFIKIFGSNEQKGKVVFFDAFTKEPKIQVDIMNNHYQKYYNGDEAPTDTQNPNPINFLTLKGSKFEVVIATKEEIKLNSEQFKGNILDIVKSELSESLEIFGIGGKTSVGYGYFNVEKSKEKRELEVILSSQNIKYIEEFKEKNPNHKFIEKINKKLNEIKEEEKGKKEEKKRQEARVKWEAVQRVDKKYYKKALEDFIANYSNSIFVEDAKKELANMGGALKPKTDNQTLDFSQAKDGKDIERVMKSVQNPTDEDRTKLEEAIKRVYPTLNAKKKKQFQRLKLVVKWLGQDKFNSLLN